MAKSLRTMQKLTALLALTLVFSSCSTIDEEPLTEALLTAGEVDQKGVQTTSIGTNYLFSDVRNLGVILASKVEVDLNNDQVSDLEFELSSGVDQDFQLLMVRSVNTALIPESSRDRHLQMSQKGESLVDSQFEWRSDEWLMLHLERNDESWSASPVTEQSGYLPIQLNGLSGWVELQLLTDSQQQVIWGVHIKGMALGSE